jgi:threonine/homoserine/homoserine lactone efflux protein
MIDLPTLGIFLAATLALNITPGPDMLYVIARGVSQGRAAGIVSALGIGGGTFVHTFVVAAGLSTLLASMPIVFDLVRYAGAAYLLYLGIRALLVKGENNADKQVPHESLWRIFRQGVITNVLNPKVALFFLAFLPQFVDPAQGAVGWQMAFLGLLFNISGTSVNAVVGLLSGSLGDRLRGHRGFWRAQRYITGTIFIGLAARLALGERR